jgi:hypothetical protein
LSQIEFHFQDSILLLSTLENGITAQQLRKVWFRPAICNQRFNFSSGPEAFPEAYFQTLTMLATQLNPSLITIAQVPKHM